MRDLKAIEVLAISFDAGDTLIFDTPSFSERIATALRECGQSYNSDALPQAMLTMQRLGLEIYLQGHALDSPELILPCTQLLLRDLGCPSDLNDVAALAERFSQQPYSRVLHPRALSLLTELHDRGFLLAVVSDWEPDLEELLTTLGVRHLLDCVSVSSIVGATKPSTKLFQYALHCLKVKPSRAIHVGDYAELDAAGARAVGMRAIVYDERGLYRDAPPPGVTYVDSFGALEAFLLSLPAPTRNGIC